MVVLLLGLIRKMMRLSTVTMRHPTMVLGSATRRGGVVLQLAPALVMGVVVIDMVVVMELVVVDDDVVGVGKMVSMVGGMMVGSGRSSRVIVTCSGIMGGHALRQRLL